MPFIYICRLNNNKYFIGSVNNRDLAMDDARRYRWVNLHGISQIDTIETENIRNSDIRSRMLEYMELHNISNVRSSVLESVTISNDIRRSLIRTIEQINRRCYNCGSRSHRHGRCPHLPRDEIHTYRLITDFFNRY